MFFENTKPAQNVFADHKIIVGLVLHDVADTDEFWMVFELFDLRFTLGAGEINPANDARDPVVLLRKPKDPTIFFNVVLRLNEDGFINASGIDERFEMLRQKGFADLFQVVAFLP